MALSETAVKVLDAMIKDDSLNEHYKQSVNLVRELEDLKLTLSKLKQLNESGSQFFEKRAYWRLNFCEGIDNCEDDVYSGECRHNPYFVMAKTIPITDVITACIEAINFKAAEFFECQQDIKKAFEE